MRQGTPFSNEKLRTGLKNLTKLYSQYGYIDYVGEPQVDFVPNTDKINVTMNVEEGKQFFIRRKVSAQCSPAAARGRSSRSRAAHRSDRCASGERRPGAEEIYGARIEAQHAERKLEHD